MKSPLYRISLSAGFFLLWLGYFMPEQTIRRRWDSFGVILLDLLAAALVYVRALFMSRARTNTVPGASGPFRDRAGVGLIFATLALMLPGAAEPGIHPKFTDRIIWFLVLAGVGAANAGATYGLCALSARREFPLQGDRLLPERIGRPELDSNVSAGDRASASSGGFTEAVPATFVDAVNH